MTIEPKIFGSWEDLQASATRAISHDSMLLTAKQLASFWRRCSVSSDFWARYLALSSPHFQIEDKVKQMAVESTLSYLLNEMFENCAKFSAGPVDAVRYDAWLYPDRLAIQMTNHITPDQVPGFAKLIDELLSSNPDEMYFQRLEENAETNQAGSGLGFLTLMKDYNIRFGFRFTPAGEGSMAVDVQAYINVKEI